MTLVRSREVLSANEAASVTGVPVKQVHRIVDAGLLQDAVENRGGTRVILSRGLVGLKFAHETAGLLTPDWRRRLVKRLLDRPTARTVEEHAVTVDVRPMEAAIRRGMSTLDRARKMVAVDNGVLTGTPCFKGTRIPVHDIAAMAANGDAKADILAAFPQLTVEQVDLAIVYAGAYPRRGRPRRSPERHKGAPLSVEELSARDLLRTP